MASKRPQGNSGSSRRNSNGELDWSHVRPRKKKPGDLDPDSDEYAEASPSRRSPRRSTPPRNEDNDYDDERPPVSRRRKSYYDEEEFDAPPPRSRRRTAPRQISEPPPRQPEPRLRFEDEPLLPESLPRRKGKKFSLFGIILFLIWSLVSLPFRIIYKITRNAKWFLIWPFRILLSVCFVACFAGGILVFLYGTIANRYDISEVQKMPERTIVLDRKNREIGRLHGENRVRVKLSEIPPIFIQALLAREDSRFYSHGGVDWIGVGRAFQQLIKHKRATQGASTLTMQLAKTTFNHQKRDINTKLVEIALAKRIEATYSKDEILEAYINRIFWGHTFMGIAAASRGYFDKVPSQLTLSECALLAGIIYGPNEFSPYKNPKGAEEVRNIVLRLLKDHGKITEDDYQSALKEPIVTRRPQSRSEENYAMELIRRELDNILEDENIRLGGLIVRTTLDLDLQNTAIDSINKHLGKLETAKGYKNPTRAQYLALPKETREKTRPDYVQAACVTIDNANGALLVVVGGRDAEESRFNRAVQSRRQVGSLFKPFVYTTFFEKGYSPSTVVSDGPIRPGEIPGAGKWSPRNSDNSFRGMQPASYGLIKSRNTMSVRIGHMAGLRNVIDHARLAGFQGKIAVTPATYLGTWEASPLDVASAYTVFANGGIRPTPYIIETISDSEDQTLFYSRKTSRRAFSQRAANMTSALLQQVTQPGGTAGQLKTLGFKAPCGGKTGTTNKYMNAWFAGYTSSLTACVWVGFDRQRTIVDRGYGGTLALPIWADIMIHAEKEGYPCGKIRTSPGSHNRAVQLCRESGQIAHSGCIAARTAYYETMPGVTPPSKMCTKHIPLAIPLEEESIPSALPAGNASPNEEEPPLALPVGPSGQGGDEDIPQAIPLDEDEGDYDENNNATRIPLALPV